MPSAHRVVFESTRPVRLCTWDVWFLNDVSMLRVSWPLVQALHYAPHTGVSPYLAIAQTASHHGNNVYPTVRLSQRTSVKIQV